MVVFAPEDSGTRVHIIHSGWRNAPEWKAARVWQSKAWAAAFKELERVSAPGP